MTGHEMTEWMQVAASSACIICAVGALRKQGMEIFAAAAVWFLFMLASSEITGQYDPPWSYAHFPLQDVICVTLAWFLWRMDRAWWKAALGVCLTLQCAAHVGYWGSFFLQDGVVTKAQNDLYLWTVNVPFVAEAAIFAVAGGRHGLGYLWDSVRQLRDRPGAHRPDAAR